MSRDRHAGIAMASLEEIQANPYQPRQGFDEGALEELVQSIRANGVIQPLIVRKNPQGGYQLIAGERRLRASKLAGLKQVPIVIRRSTDREALEMALVENIQRQDLNCIDEALAYLQLVQDFSLTQEEVSHRVGKDRATIANHLRLLRLPEAIIEDLRQQVLSFGHGKALLAIESNETRLQIRNRILEEKLSVRATEALIGAFEQGDQNGKNTEVPATLEKTGETSIQARMRNLGKDLTHQWGARIQLKGSEKQGKIIIHYASQEDLERILVAMQNKDLWVVQQT